MIVKARVKEISKIGSDSIDVLFQFNGIELWAFSDTQNFEKGKKYEIELTYLEEEISDESFWNQNTNREQKIEPSDERGRYYCYGMIVQVNPVKIDFGSLLLNFGDWINDESVVGEYVYVVIARFDAIPR